MNPFLKPAGWGGVIFAFALGAAWNWPQTIGAMVVVLGVLIAQGMLRWPR